MLKLIRKIYEALQLVLLQVMKCVNFFNRNVKIQRFLDLRSPQQFLTIASQTATKFKTIQSNQTHAKLFWFHVSSAGELEQAASIARFLNEHISAFFFVTYYSASAEPFLKNFPGLLGASGLPIDVVSVYEKAYKHLPVEKIFFVRYDIWPGLVLFANKHGIELNLLCATKQKTTLGWRSKLSEKWNLFLYKKFNHIFVTTQNDAQYLQSKLPKQNIVFAGDTKWNRAQERAKIMRENFDLKENPSPFVHFYHDIKNYIQIHHLKCVVFGSPHAEEHEIAINFLKLLEKKCLLIYVPHHVSKESCSLLYQNMKDKGAVPCLYSEIIHLKDTLSKRPKDFNVIIVDEMGKLAEIYALGQLAVIGGGFDGKIHNVIEACAHGVPVLIGPNFARAIEVKMLVEAHVAFAFKTANLLFQFLAQWVILDGDMNKLHAAREQAIKIFESLPNTNKIILDTFLQEIQHVNKTIDHKYNRL